MSHLCYFSWVVGHIDYTFWNSQLHNMCFQNILIYINVPFETCKNRTSVNQKMLHWENALIVLLLWAFQYLKHGNMYQDLSTEESLFPDDNTYKSATTNENQSKNRSMDILAGMKNNT